MNPYETSLYLYNLTLVPIIFFSALFLMITIISIWVNKEKKQEFKELDYFPFISVQIPTFNDPIAVRCVKRCMNFDYPKDKFEIIIADDSTNIKTQKLLKDISDKHPDFVKHIHRDNREGFKPGALKNAMSITKGEFIVVFDSDWIPRKNFLKKIINPFADPKVAIVQTRQGFYNHRTNIITRFAAYLLMIYHTIMMPINNKVNCVFFCGTAGALRRSAFDKVGGWDTKSVTEDSELSVRLLLKGYKSVYLEYETPSEVPDSFEGFIKQQMRWCYGNARVFFDNAKKILVSKNLKLGQKLMILFVTLTNSSAFFVVIMTLFGLSGWFLGEPRLVTFTDFMNLISRFLLTGGFLFAGFITLYKRKQLKEFPSLVFSTLIMGIVIAFSNGVAFYKAALNQKLNWFCTPKVANTNVIKNDS